MNFSERPYDDILTYENDGPEFKAGDRVITNRNLTPGLKNGHTGTVIDFYSGVYLICFDNITFGHNGSGNNNIPEGHGWWVEGHFLDSIF